jgi:hypothetical protein
MDTDTDVEEQVALRAITLNGHQVMSADDLALILGSDIGHAREVGDRLFDRGQVRVSLAPPGYFL